MRRKDLSIGPLRVIVKDISLGDIILNNKDNECMVLRIDNIYPDTIVYTKDIVTGDDFIMNLKSDREHLIFTIDPGIISSPFIGLIGEKKYLYLDPDNKVTFIAFIDDSIKNLHTISKMPISYIASPRKGEEMIKYPIRIEIPNKKKPVIFDGNRWSFV